MKVKDMSTEQILNLLTKDELIQYFKHRYLISKRTAASIAVEELSNRQIKSLENPKEKLISSKQNKTWEDHLKIISAIKKEQKEYDRLDKKINELEELLK